MSEKWDAPEKCPTCGGPAMSELANFDNGPLVWHHLPSGGVPEQGPLGHWEGPQEIFDALVRDAMQWRAATLHPPRLAWDGLRDVICAYVPNTRLTAGDSAREIVLAAVDRLADAHAGQLRAALERPRPALPDVPVPKETCPKCGAPVVIKKIAPTELNELGGSRYTYTAYPTEEAYLAVCAANEKKRQRIEELERVARPALPAPEPPQQEIQQ